MKLKSLKKLKSPVNEVPLICSGILTFFVISFCILCIPFPFLPFIIIYEFTVINTNEDMPINLVFISTILSGTYIATGFVGGNMLLMNNWF